MAARQVLVDGYNVIRADPNLSALEHQSLEAARDALIKNLASSPRFLGDMVTVVFDGAARSFAGNRRYGGVTATYSAAGSSADEVIKARATAASDKASTVIVTDDLDIRTFCAGIGCIVTSSQNLLRQMATPRKLEPPRPRPVEYDDERSPSTTEKKGNPRRRPKRLRKERDYRF